MFLLAAAEMTLALGIGQGFRATHDVNGVVAARIDDRRDNADPFLTVRSIWTKCDSSGTTECHRAQSAIAGLRFHSADSQWFGVDLGIGAGRITAIFNPSPSGFYGKPSVGDVIPVLSGGIDFRFSIAGAWFARVEGTATAWPSWSFRELIELNEFAGIGLAF